MKSKIFLIIGMLLVFIALCMIYVFAVSNRNPQVQKTIPNNRGFSLSPKKFEEPEFSSFFKKIKDNFGFVSWAGSFSNLERTQSAPLTVIKLSNQYNYQPIIILNFSDDNNHTFNVINSSEVLQKIKKFVVDNDLKYLGLGIEVNILYENNKDEFNKFVEFFQLAYSEIKSVSPKTKIFTIFQLERIKGLKGGLFGGDNNSIDNWDLLNSFKESDLFVFTTYPFLVFKNPEEIPQDYYQIKTDKPTAFIEVGWTRRLDIDGWESDSEEQYKFVEKFLDLNKNANREFMIWSFMYDPIGDFNEIFKYIGMIDTEENPQYQLWKNN